MDIPAVLLAICPGSSWSLNGEDYEGLQWLDELPKPTFAEIQAAWPTVLASQTDEQTRRSRLAAFRDEADPLFFGWQRGENTEQAWLDACQDIRDRLPYVTV